jgi:hypothetical protein
LPTKIRIRRSHLDASDATPGSARQLSGRRGRSIDQRCDLVEGQAEHVVQDEGESHIVSLPGFMGGDTDDCDKEM